MNVYPKGSGATNIAKNAFDHLVMTYSRSMHELVGKVDTIGKVWFGECYVLKSSHSTMLLY